MPERVAVVTGAARGIGAAIAVKLAADGFAVAVLDLEEAACKETVERITAAGGRAMAVGADVSDAAAVQTAVERVAAELGPPVVLVNNAGVIRDNLLFKMTDDDWEIVMAVHLRGAFLMSRACQKYMTEQKWGRIVNLSSTSALGNRGQANYSAAKAGLQGLRQDARDRVGSVRRHRERDRARFHRHRHDRGDGGPDGARLRDLQGGCRGADPGSPGRTARGHRQHGVVPGQRGRRLRLRPGHLRRRRSP